LASARTDVNSIQGGLSTREEGNDVMSFVNDYKPIVETALTSLSSQKAELEALGYGGQMIHDLDILANSVEDLGKGLVSYLPVSDFASAHIKDANS
jgi:hypothetical protein